MVPVIRLTKRFTFEAAHALNNHDGECKYIHGHSYKLLVTIIGNPNCEKNNPKAGMVIDFKDLKQIIKKHIIDEYDHSIILNNTNQTELINTLSKDKMKIVTVNFQTTCENILAHFAKILTPILKEKNIQLFSIKLYETEDSYAEWHANDQN